MTEKEFAACIALLCASIGKEMSREQSSAWFTMLSDLTFEQLKAGIVTTIRDYKFAGFPPIGVIRDNCGVKSGHIQAKDKPTLAWEAVRRAINRVGAYDSPKFDDAVINAALRSLGGWVAVCDWTVEELPWRQKEFMAAYASLAGVQVEAEICGRLAGIAEKENGPVLPVREVDVGCLTTGGVGERRLIDDRGEVQALPVRDPAIAGLAKRLEVQSEPIEPKRLPSRSRDEQIAALMGRAGA